MKQGLLPSYPCVTTPSAEVLPPQDPKRDQATVLSNLTSNQSSSPPEDNILQFVTELFSITMS